MPQEGEQALLVFSCAQSEAPELLHVYCVWSWMDETLMHDQLLYFCLAFPAPGRRHSSLTQWAELHITLEQRGIKLPQTKQKVNSEKQRTTVVGNTQAAQGSSVEVSWPC